MRKSIEREPGSLRDLFSRSQGASRTFCIDFLINLNMKSVRKSIEKKPRNLRDIMYRFPYQFDKEIHRKGAKEPHGHFFIDFLINLNQKSARKSIEKEPRTSGTFCIEFLIDLIGKSIERESGSLREMLYRFHYQFKE